MPRMPTYEARPYARPDRTPAAGVDGRRSTSRAEFRPLTSRSAYDMHPSALAQLIDQLGGRQISLPRAKIVSVINPRAFLVGIGRVRWRQHRGNTIAWSSSSTGGTIARWIRCMLVGMTVRITGIARTVLGMQVAREVPWPRAADTGYRPAL